MDVMQYRCKKGRAVNACIVLQVVNILFVIEFYTDEMKHAEALHRCNKIGIIYKRCKCPPKSYETITTSKSVNHSTVAPFYRLIQIQQMKIIFIL